MNSMGFAVGFAVRVSAYFKWECTIFVQTPYEEDAKRKAYAMAKTIFNTNMPETLEDVKIDDGIYVEVLTNIDRIILYR